MSDDEALKALQSEVAELRARVDSLRGAVADARGSVHLSMRDQARCPNCGGRRLAHFPKVQFASWGSPLGPRGLDLGLGVRKRFTGPKPVTLLEAWVCAGCALVEWHVADLAALDEESDAFEWVEGETPEQGPFR